MGNKYYVEDILKVVKLESREGYSINIEWIGRVGIVQEIFKKGNEWLYCLSFDEYSLDDVWFFESELVDVEEIRNDLKQSTKNNLLH